MSDDTPKFALTVRDPWAQAIIYGPKRIENRTRKPPSKIIGERIAIHCGKTHATVLDDDPDVLRQLGRAQLHATEYSVEERGRIIGTARVVGWWRVQERTVGGEFCDPDLSEPLQIIGGELDWRGHGDPDNDPWWTGPVGWLLDDVRELAEPVPARGMPGVWTIDDEVREMMEVQQ
jgi:hypothetical protein